MGLLTQLSEKNSVKKLDSENEKTREIWASTDLKIKTLGKTKQHFDFEDIWLYGLVLFNWPLTPS